MLNLNKFQRTEFFNAGNLTKFTQGNQHESEQDVQEVIFTKTLA